MVRHRCNMSLGVGCGCRIAPSVISNGYLDVKCPAFSALVSEAFKASFATSVLPNALQPTKAKAKAKADHMRDVPPRQSPTRQPGQLSPLAKRHKPKVNASKVAQLHAYTQAHSGGQAWLRWGWLG